MKIIYIYRIIENIEATIKSDKELLQKSRTEKDKYFLRGKIFAEKAVLNKIKQGMEEE